MLPGKEVNAGPAPFDFMGEPGVTLGFIIPVNSLFFRILSVASVCARNFLLVINIQASI